MKIKKIKCLKTYYCNELKYFGQCCLNKKKFKPYNIMLIGNYILLQNSSISS